MNAKSLAWLDAQQTSMRADLIELCNQNSGSRNLRGLLRVADWLEDWMHLPDTPCQRIELPTRTVVTDDGSVLQSPTGPVLRWDFQPDRHRRVLLAIHYDTVFSEESAFQSCTSLGNDRLQGPGTADAKGGIIVLKYALQAAIQFQAIESIGVSVVLNPDEELGSPSSADYLQSLAGDFDFGLLFEPCLPSGQLVSQRKGSGNYDLVVRGKAAHAGRHFEDGRNALVLLSQILIDLDRLNGQRSGATINVGHVVGGGAVNTVPELAVGRFNVRLATPECVAWFEERLRDLVDQANRQDGFAVELYGGISSPPKLESEAAGNLMTAIEQATWDIEQRSVQWTATGGVCDGNKLAAAGLPNIDTLGPVGDGLHSSREWVQVSSLPTKAKIIARLLECYACGKFELPQSHTN